MDRTLKRPSPDDPSGFPSKRPRNDGLNGMQRQQPGAAGATALLAQQEKRRKMVEEARARATAIAANLSGGGGAPKPAAPAPAASASASSPATDMARRMAEMKARVAAAVNKPPGTVAPAPALEQNFQRQAEAAPVDDTPKPRGGLDVGIHPALLAESIDTSSSGSSKRGGRQQIIPPKFATTMANRRIEPLPQQTHAAQKPKKQIELQKPEEDNSKNPYYDPNLGAGASKQKSRVSKGLVFNQKGKYIEQANALRRQAQLEAMKKRIADAARRAGIDEEMDTDRAFLVDPPPDVEWWDQGLCETYDDVGTEKVKIDTPDSIITIYIQHPILLEPPMEKFAPAPKPLPLTKKEQKKVRLNARMVKLKDHQSKIQLGLLPAPPPKLTRQNMMRVLGEEAVKNPTAVEARVNKEIAARLEKHERENEDRKLTKDQRHEKLANNQEKDLAKGIHCLVFRIESLANGQHCYKIKTNAEQHALVGLCIVNPKFNLVIVEGGVHSITKYRKLMVNRIKWHESGASKATDADPDSRMTDADTSRDVKENKCTLVWEGELKNRTFKKFTWQNCETEGEAKKLLERHKMDNYWTLAKNKEHAVD